MIELDKDRLHQLYEHPELFYFKRRPGYTTQRLVDLLSESIIADHENNLTFFFVVQNYSMVRNIEKMAIDLCEYWCLEFKISWFHHEIRILHDTGTTHIIKFITVDRIEEKLRGYDRKYVFYDQF